MWNLMTSKAMLLIRHTHSIIGTANDEYECIPKYETTCSALSGQQWWLFSVVFMMSAYFTRRKNKFSKIFLKYLHCCQNYERIRLMVTDNTCGTTDWWTMLFQHFKWRRISQEVKSALKNVRIHSSIKLSEKNSVLVKNEIPILSVWGFRNMERLVQHCQDDNGGYFL